MFLTLQPNVDVDIRLVCFTEKDLPAISKKEFGAIDNDNDHISTNLSSFD